MLIKFVCVTIQTKPIENNAHVVLFTVLLDKMFSRYVDKSLQIVDNSRESNFRGNSPFSRLVFLVCITM